MVDASDRWLRLEIDPVIRRAEHISAHVQRELPNHAGLIRAAAGVAHSAQEAKRVARALRRPWGLHRLPVLFLAVALLGFAAWIYWQFFHVATLRIAIPEDDAVQLQQQLAHSTRVRFQQVDTKGSRENVQLLTEQSVDLAFVQGGIPLPEESPRLKYPTTDTVLYFVREGVHHPHGVKRIMTASETQGSHSVAQVFTRLWQIDGQVQFTHDWSTFCHDNAYRIPADVDAVFIVKDTGKDQTLWATERLSAAGFRLMSPNIGAHATTLDYLQRTEIPSGYLGQDPPMPDQPIVTYSVATYLAARPGLTPRLLAAAAHLRDEDANTLAARGFEPTLGEAAQLLQGVEAVLSIVIYIGLAFLALLGLEVTTYRPRFNELNTLVSLLSMHQSDKDVLGLTSEALRRENLLYLSICSDLLGLIGVVTGYYAQENPSLLYGNLLDIIHERSDRLKLNIQTKILHASVTIGAPGTGESGTEPNDGGE
jgi:hypothetical protein